VILPFKVTFPFPSTAKFGFSAVPPIPIVPPTNFVPVISEPVILAPVIFPSQSTKKEPSLFLKVLPVMVAPEILKVLTLPDIVKFPLLLTERIDFVPSVILIMLLPSLPILATTLPSPYTFNPSQVKAKLAFD
jgi:hypothetical protein